MPLVYTLNWNGNFNNVFKTRWSASVMNEAKSHNMYYYALGNELNLGKWNAFVDFMYSKEDIDRKGIITSIVGRAGITLLMLTIFRLLPSVITAFFRNGMFL